MQQTRAGELHGGPLRIEALAEVLLQAHHAEDLIVTHFFLWFVVAGVASITIDRRVVPSAITYLIAFVYLCHAPEQRWVAMVLSNLVLSVNLLVAWASPVKDNVPGKSVLQ